MTMERKSHGAPQAEKIAPSKKPPRKKPGSSGKGDYYHIEIRPKKEFAIFRTQDVGEAGHIQRVAGKRFGARGSWATVKWLIGKEDAHVNKGRLIPDTEDARELLKKLGSKPVQLVGDRFKARPRSTASRDIKTA